MSLRDGTQLDVEDARITTDSIIGFTGDPRTRFAVARREVTDVETLQGDGPKSFATGGLLMLTFFGALVIYAAHID